MAAPDGLDVNPHLTTSLNRTMISERTVLKRRCNWANESPEPWDNFIKGSMDLRKYIRDVPDFPQPGIIFKDITPLLGHPPALRYAVDKMGEMCAALNPDAIVCIEARGFLFAAPIAYQMSKPLVPVRKMGKLPYRTHSVTYDLEYGTDTVEVHIDAISDGSRVVIVDDLLATGGTMAAATKLIERTGGEIAGLSVLVELTDLNGRARLSDYDVISLIKY